MAIVAAEREVPLANRSDEFVKVGRQRAAFFRDVEALQPGCWVRLVAG